MGNKNDIVINKTDRLAGLLSLPASKSSSTRALLTASVTQGISTITNVATGFNTVAMQQNCERLGAEFSISGSVTTVQGIDPYSIKVPITFDVGNSGVVLRLLMGVSGHLPEVNFKTEYANSLGVRSQTEMIQALRLLGVECQSTLDDDRLPIMIKSRQVLQSYTEVSCQKSSQFLSGLLYFGAISRSDLKIKVVDHITAPSMVHTTINNLRQAGILIDYDDAFRTFWVKGTSQLVPTDFLIGADPASTAAILSLCGSMASQVLLSGFFEEELGSGAVIQYLIDTGSQLEYLPNNKIKVTGDTKIMAQDFDGSLAPDAVPALAARAAFANGTSIFYNIEHIRYKESDRISDFRSELNKLGVASDEKRDQLIIHGNPNGYQGGVTLNGHYDHGLIMALTTIGLHCDLPVRIREPFHVGQTYPEYFNDIMSLGANIIHIEV